ncbi:hypothetical protein [Asticcacaulis sp. AC402]|uniref:hypothetical protein n=1 Tax=Asticcacaulis sp. AC402 TaxID=1282361 RepID=UPI0003C3BF78|nr:hypothetical protein [Asticcacaulis sp. AC402]ESQ75949.1 hypothetical protein ABAC402_05765 [Asticcacaulis sp. AC402]
MKISTTALTVAMAVALTLPLAAPSHAGPASEALSRCLIQKSTKTDRANLARWIFGVIARHPSVSDLSAMTDAKYEKVNRAAGDVFTRLMAVDCAAESAEALRAESSDGFGQAFKSLGELAMTELMGDPAVQSGSSDLVKYIDLNAFAQAIISNGGADKKK